MKPSNDYIFLLSVSLVVLVLILSDCVQCAFVHSCMLIFRFVCRRVSLCMCCDCGSDRSKAIRPNTQPERRETPKRTKFSVELNKKKSVKRQKAIDELSKWMHILELGNKIILSEFEWLKNTSYACDMVLEIIYISLHLVMVTCLINSPSGVPCF